MILFDFEGQKLATILEIKYIENQSSRWAPIFIIFNEKKSEGFRCTFDLQNQKEPRFFIHTKLELRLSLFIPELS